jgi:hypothetical protein
MDTSTINFCSDCIDGNFLDEPQRALFFGAPRPIHPFGDLPRVHSATLLPEGMIRSSKPSFFLGGTRE